MIKKLLVSFLFSQIAFLLTQASTPLSIGKWRALLHREDGRDIVFNFEVSDSSGYPQIWILNGSERLPTEEAKIEGDSLFFRMTVFESSFRAQIKKDGTLSGYWVVRLIEGMRDFPFSAYPASYRFPTDRKHPPVNVNGKWAVTFSRMDTNYQRPAIAEFKQDGNYITGTFLTHSGDYRFLEGVVTGDSVKLSTFDGHHSFLFLAKLTQSKLLEGMFFSGAARTEKWTGRFDPNAVLPESEKPMLLIDSLTRISFRFPDLDSTIVSPLDKPFEGKVLLIQFMGSWCANCMDEIRFLSDYYKKNRQRGFEVIALCLERSSDFHRSVNSIRKFQHRFDVQYPMLVTGVTSDDPLKAEKTVPQINRIAAFPSFLLLDRKGKVVWIHTGFDGPGTGEHYLEFQKEFNQRLDSLLEER